MKKTLLSKRKEEHPLSLCLSSSEVDGRGARRGPTMVAATRRWNCRTILRRALDGDHQPGAFAGDFFPAANNFLFPGSVRGVFTSKRWRTKTPLSKEERGKNSKKKMFNAGNTDEENPYEIVVDEEDKGDLGDGNSRVIIRVQCTECLKKGTATSAKNEEAGQFFESQLSGELLCGGCYLKELKKLQDNYIKKVGSNWQV
jgi:hypothetical protein